MTASLPPAKRVLLFGWLCTCGHTNSLPEKWADLCAKCGRVFSSRTDECWHAVVRT